jgi:hypothetical protein
MPSSTERRVAVRATGPVHRPRRRLVGVAVAALFFVCVLVRPDAAAAFTFSDGAQAPCLTDEGVATEYVHPPGDATAPGGFIGFTHLDPAAGWIIDWNGLMLSSAPSYAHDFIFFHECAHAKARTFDELKANCLGLIDMRAAGRAGPKIEARLAVYHQKLGYMGRQYGWGNDYWARTVACANDAAAAARLRSAPSSRREPGS